MEAGRGLAPPAFTLTLCNETSVAPAPIPISIWASHCARMTYPEAILAPRSPASPYLSVNVYKAFPH
jgi:hypothetical protein